MKKKVITNGLVHVYSGDGKGKTTASLGQALRALGYGLTVLMVQFLKDKDDISGELHMVKKLAPNLKIIRLKQKHPLFLSPQEVDYEALKISVQELFTIAKDAILTQTYDLVILDEINNVLKEGLLRAEDVLDLIRIKPKSVELILTGRDAMPEIIRAADLVTEMRKIKHPLDRGISAREGIEY
ncbi:MAG: cob(I)yrinic acid a,c-diamide adenosyltransferase [bacterium]